MQSAGPTKSKGSHLLCLPVIALFASLLNAAPGTSPFASEPLDFASLIC